MAPGQETVDDRLGDQLLAEEHPQHLGAKEPLDVLGVEPGKRVEGKQMERETGIEPATNGLEGRDSTTELLPLEVKMVEVDGFEPP